MKMKLLTLIGLFLALSTSIKAQDFRSIDKVNGIAVGEKAPLFEAMDETGNTFNLENTLKTQAVVLVFFRGEWCPICSQHMKDLQENLELIKKTGAKVVAVSPQKPEYLKKMKEKAGVDFAFIYDEGFKISDAYDLTFLPTSKQLTVYNYMLGAKLEKSQTDDSQRLPVPATFVIQKDGKIAWRQFDRNYKNRSEPEAIIAALNECSSDCKTARSKNTDCSQTVSGEKASDRAKPDCGKAKEVENGCG